MKGLFLRLLRVWRGVNPDSGEGKLLLNQAVGVGETRGNQRFPANRHYLFGNKFLQQFKLDKSYLGVNFCGFKHFREIRFIRAFLNVAGGKDRLRLREYFFARNVFGAAFVWTQEERTRLYAINKKFYAPVFADLGAA